MKMQNLLEQLKELGCIGIKISFEDEGALLNEIITMRNLSQNVGIELFVKIGGCEAKRDIVDCINLSSDGIVSPMIESNFSLQKYFNSLEQYKFSKQRGFNVETISGYENINKMEMNKFDFITLGRVDFVGSINKDRSFVNSEEMFEISVNIFSIAKKQDLKCCLGGGVSVESKSFIEKLTNLKLLDKFETRYIIFDVSKINFDKFDHILYLANLFELEWMKYVSNRYSLFAKKDKRRIEMIEERMNKNRKLE